MKLSRKYISEILFNGEIPSEDYLNDVPAVRWLARENELKIRKNVTFFIGENGSGKSTLIEAIAVCYGFNPEGGTLNYNFSTHDTHSELCNYIRVAKKAYPKNGYFLRAETLYNLATYRLDVFKNEIACGIKKDFHCMSHGEFFLGILDELPGKGIYIFDEPEAALSPVKLLTLMYHIKRLENKGSQFIIATHSPILMAYPDADIFQFNEKGIERVEYTDTEHYLVTKTFLDAPEKTLGRLFT